MRRLYNIVTLTNNELRRVTDTLKVSVKEDRGCWKGAREEVDNRDVLASNITHTITRKCTHTHTQNNRLIHKNNWSHTNTHTHKQWAAETN